MRAGTRELLQDFATATRQRHKKIRKTMRSIHFRHMLETDARTCIDFNSFYFIVKKAIHSILFYPRHSFIPTFDPQEKYMNKIFASTLCATLLASFSCLASAAPPADAPAGTTGLCKDGSYYSGAEKKGACRGHKGVKDWYADSTTKATAPAAASPAPAAAAPAAAPAPATAMTKSAPAAAPAKSAATPAAAAALGGGAGKVWVNASTKVYHCQGDKWYGKTKQGEYMSEADAKAKGFHGDHGKTCQS